MLASSQEINDLIIKLENVSNVDDRRGKERWKIFKDFAEKYGYTRDLNDTGADVGDEVMFVRRVYTTGVDKYLNSVGKPYYLGLEVLWTTILSELEDSGRSLFVIGDPDKMWKRRKIMKSTLYKIGCFGKSYDKNKESISSSRKR